jgi:putative thioredoxin
MTAPVVLVLYSTSQALESATMAADVATVAGEYDGRFLAGLIDIDASPAIAQAMQIPQVPMLFVLLDGRPATQPIPGLINLEELRTLFQQLGQQLTAQGITGRHQPRSTVPPAGVAEDPEEPFVDPRYAAAQDALGEGNIDLAVAEYQKLVDGNPADAEAAAAYQSKLVGAHLILVTAMKCKQTTDPATVDQLRQVITAFKAAYMPKDHDHKH